MATPHQPPPKTPSFPLWLCTETDYITSLSSPLCDWQCLPVENKDLSFPLTELSIRPTDWEQEWYTSFQVEALGVIARVHHLLLARSQDQEPGSQGLKGQGTGQQSCDWPPITVWTWANNKRRLLWITDFFCYCFWQFYCYWLLLQLNLEKDDSHFNLICINKEFLLKKSGEVMPRSLAEVSHQIHWWQCITYAKKWCHTTA